MRTPEQWEQMHQALENLRKQVDGFASSNPGISVSVGNVTVYPEALPTGGNQFRPAYIARTSVKVTLMGNSKSK
jgi:hypothetical protein